MLGYLDWELILLIMRLLYNGFKIWKLVEGNYNILLPLSQKFNLLYIKMCSFLNKTNKLFSYIISQISSTKLNVSINSLILVQQFKKLNSQVLHFLSENGTSFRNRLTFWQEGSVYFAAYGYFLLIYSCGFYAITLLLIAQKVE